MALWTPADLTGTFAWYEQTDTGELTLREDTGNFFISARNDLGNAGVNISQATTTAQPQYVANVSGGKAVARYNGTSHFLNAGVQSIGTATLFAATGETWFVLWLGAPTYATAGTPLSKSGGTASSATLIVRATVTGTTLDIRVRGTVTGYGSGLTAGVAQLVLLKCINGTTTGRWNGADVGAIGIGAATINSVNIAFGCRNPGTAIEFYAGDEFVSIIGDAALTQAVEEQLEGYAAHQFGVQAILPVDHPYRNTAPMTGPTYTQTAFRLYNDDGSGLGGPP